MEQLQKLYSDILHHGRWSGNRTNMKTVKLFGYFMRFDMEEGFPLSTTRKLYVRSVIHELIWFLKGDTNIRYLIENNVHIWDEWALTEDQTRQVEIPYQARIEMYAQNREMSLDAAHDLHHNLSNTRGFKFSLAELDAAGVPTHSIEIIREKGELGPIYGEKWRRWNTGATDMRGEPVRIDQIQYVVDTLRKNPNSRRIMVTALDPKDLPDERYSPQENVLAGRQALAPCHTMFQLGTLPMSIQERFDWAAQKYEENKETMEGNDIWRAFYEAYIDPAGKDFDWNDALHEELDRLGVPKHYLSLMLYQRSADCYLGVPTNIASYALLLSMLAHVTNMVPYEFIHALGDTHLYENQIDNVKEVLNRTPKSLPKLWLNPEIKEINDFTADDIRIIDYNPHPALEKVEVAV